MKFSVQLLQVSVFLIYLIIEERQLKNQNIIEYQSLPKLFILLYTCEPWLREGLKESGIEIMWASSC